MAAAIKMDELLVTWLSSDAVYEHVLEWIENFRASSEAQQRSNNNSKTSSGASLTLSDDGESSLSSLDTAANVASLQLQQASPVSALVTTEQPPQAQQASLPKTVHPPQLQYPPPLAPPPSRTTRTTTVVIPKFYEPPPKDDIRLNDDHDYDDSDEEEGSIRSATHRRRRRTPPLPSDMWDPSPMLPPPDVAEPTSTTAPLPPGADGLGLSPLDVDASANSATPTPMIATSASNATSTQQQGPNTDVVCAGDLARALFLESGQDPPLTSPVSVSSSVGVASGGGKPRTTEGPVDLLDAGAEDDLLNVDVVGGATDEDDDDDDDLFDPPDLASSSLRRKYLTPEAFVRVTKEVCRFPSFFNLPLYQRILDLYNAEQAARRRKYKQRRKKGGDQEDPIVVAAPMEVVTYSMLEWYWKREMEPYDASERFFRLVKQPENDFIVRDDFLPFIKALLDDHPGLEFLSSHAEFQEKYAVTVITRIFYCVNRCHSGRITSRQIRRSDLLEAFSQVDEEEDINKVTRYFSYEHFYVLYCRFWELDGDRDYRITREDLLKYGDHSLSHMIVDRIFDAAPRPFGSQQANRDFLSYEDFIYFMLSEEDKSNEVSVRYWFTCVDVDGDGRLNNMEMRSFYAVQLHRMQCMGHEIVPFEDMLCQMMDMIKPAKTEYLVVEDFLQPECCQVSGALFDALFNLNKYLMFEQRDPFVERQKREDEFECDWDRFACIDYNRLAMEEEAREEEAMEIDWVTVDDEAEQQQQQQQQAADADGYHHHAAGSSEAPF